MTRKPPPKDPGELIHLLAHPKPGNPDAVSRVLAGERPPERHHIRPRVSMVSEGAALAQVVIGGVEWVIDSIEHADDGERFTVTISGPMRALEHGDRVEQGARMAAEVVRRVRTP